MISRNAYRNSLSNVYEGKPVDNLLEPQVQYKTQNQPDTQRSGDTRQIANENAPGKYMKFEMEDERMKIIQMVVTCPQGLSHTYINTYIYKYLNRIYEIKF